MVNTTTYYVIAMFSYVSALLVTMLVVNFGIMFNLAIILVPSLITNFGTDTIAIWCLVSMFLSTIVTFFHTVDRVSRYAKGFYD